MGSLIRDFFLNKILFFNLFDQSAKNTVEMATLLMTVVDCETACERASIFKNIDKMENAGDDITHKIYLYLDKIVFTPLNRNDIHALAAAIDDVADAIQEASGRMFLYDIDEFSPAIKQIAAIILQAGIEIEKTIRMLRSIRKTDKIIEICRQIKNYERQSDQIYYHAVAELFAAEKNAIKLLKYREILSSLETAVSKCKKVTDVLNTTLINR